MTLLELFLLGVANFAVSAVADVFWARWTLTSNRHQSNQAALWAALIVVASWVYWIAFHATYWMVVPLTVGAAVGTKVTVVRDARKGS